MLSKRRFLGCALCAATALVADGGKAQAQGLTRTELRRIEYPNNIVIVQMIVDIPANAEVAKHTHPGVESTLVLEGELTLEVAGQPTQVLKKGDAFQVPPVTVHGGRVGAGNCKLFAHFVVDKDKPLASPA